MPAIITHLLSAKFAFNYFNNSTLPKLKKPIFYLGAFLPDALFVYKPFFNRHNLGKLFHKQDVYNTFKNMKFYCENNLTDSYATSLSAGIITHYALDTTFHPFVYNLEYKIKNSLNNLRKKDALHFLIERDIDYFLFHNQTTLLPKNFVFEPILKDDIINTYPFMYYLFKNSFNVTITQKEYLKTINRFINYQKIFLDTSGNKRNFFYALEKLLFLPHQLSFMFLRDNPNYKFTNYTNKTLPNQKDIYSLQKDANNLSISLIDTFLKTKGAQHLPYAQFSTSFNVGKL